MLLFPEMPVTRNILPPYHRKSNFFNRFSEDIVFSSLPFFDFFDYFLLLLLFVCCFMNLKMYILIHIRLCGRVSGKMFFTRPISGKKTPFFGLTSLFVQKSSTWSNTIQISHDLNAQNRCNNYKPRMKINKK